MADVPFAVIGVSFRRGMAVSSAESVSFSFIHSKDVPVFTVSFRDARRSLSSGRALRGPVGADPESRGFDHIWIPGSPAKRAGARE
jgi:hypothetical protein